MRSPAYQLRRLHVFATGFKSHIAEQTRKPFVVTRFIGSDNSESRQEPHECGHYERALASLCSWVLSAGNLGRNLPLQVLYGGAILPWETGLEPDISKRLRHSCRLRGTMCEIAAQMETVEIQNPAPRAQNLEVI